MNNMELASLIISPVPRMQNTDPTKVHKVHKKRTQSKRKNKTYVKEKNHKMTRIKFQSKPKSVNKLVDKLIKNKKEKDKEDDDDVDDDGSGSGSGDSWDEEDISTTDDQGYTSSKRSKIPHRKGKEPDR